MVVVQEEEEEEEEEEEDAFGTSIHLKSNACLQFKEALGIDASPHIIT